MRSNSVEPFTTIDDLKELAQELVTGLTRLSTYKQPLAVRKARAAVAREEVIDVSEESKKLSGASCTYFFDVKKTGEGKPYLVITRSRKAQGEFKRESVTIFPEDAKEFAEAVSEMTAKL